MPRLENFFQRSLQKFWYMPLLAQNSTIVTHFCMVCLLIRLAKLQVLQNTVARVVSLTRKYDHITPVLESLHWLPVKFRIVFKVLLLVYKALNGMAPSYLSDMLCYRSYSRSLRSASQKLLVVHRTNMKTYGDWAFSIAGPKLWN